MRRRTYIATSGGLAAAMTTGVSAFSPVAAQEDDELLFDEYTELVATELEDRGLELVDVDHRRLLVELVTTTDEPDTTASSFHEITGYIIGGFAGYAGQVAEPPALGLVGSVFESSEAAESYVEAGADDGAEPFATYGANTTWAIDAWETNDMDTYSFEVLMTIDPPAY